MSNLRWNVEVLFPGSHVWEAIAAFNSDVIAIEYASSCANSKAKGWSYRVRVTRGTKRVLATFEGAK